MHELLLKLLELSEQGRLNIDNVRLSDRGHEINIGEQAEAFEGEIKLEVTCDADVIELGNMLKQAIDKEN